MTQTADNNKPPKRKVSPGKDTIAGGFGGICAVMIGQPLDTIKVRLQTMPTGAGQTPLYNGMIDCARKTIRNEGVTGLYKGMSAPLVGVAPIFSLSFFGFSVGKRLQQEHSTDVLRPGQLFAAGMLSGVMTTTIMAPGERIKCLLQVQQGQAKPKYSGPIDVVRQLHREGGLRSVYRGTMATLLRDIPASGAYFAGYEWIRRQVAGNADELSMAATLFAGGLAGVLCWTVGLPADVAKSRLQSAPDGTYPKGLRSVFREILSEGGVLALYRGVTPVMIRAFVANAGVFLGYELCIWSLNKVC